MSCECNLVHDSNNRRKHIFENENIWGTDCLLLYDMFNDTVRRSECVVWNDAFTSD